MRPNNTHEIEKGKYHYEAHTGNIYRYTKEGELEPCTFERNNGRYLSVNNDGKLILAHRLAWYLFYGQWPEGEIDHIDRDKHNNRISNLREAKHWENLQNRPTPGARNLEGKKLRGVYHTQRGTPYEVKFVCNNEHYYLGRFKSLYAAAVAYNEKATELMGEFAQLNDLGQFSEEEKNAVQ
jgi:hypothetical protein